jgi:ATP-dependent helicase/nuclease subunit B
MTGPDRLALAAPIDAPDVPAVEIASPTRRDEARSAMAVAAALRDRGVPVRDLAVAVRDLDSYEEPLFRAALQYEIAPVFWTQLRVTRTRPYALVESVCEALAGDAADREALLRPLELRWSPAGSDGRSNPTTADDSSSRLTDWPIESEAVHRAREALPDGPRSVPEWIEAIDAADGVDDRFRRFAEWLDGAPEPDPESVAALLGEAIEGYADSALPETRAADSPALLDTETDARAVVRVRTLVRQLRHKFADRLAEGTLERSWGDAADLAGVIATQRPGRREHSNARALDVFEANDLWALEVPYVIAVGLTAEEWPRPPESELPPEFQEAVLRGDGPSDALAPQPAWVGGRDRDQFADALRAAGECVVVTRHTRAPGGDDVARSPLLDHLDTRRISEESRRRLVGEERALPPGLREVVGEEATTGDECRGETGADR